VFHGKCCTYCGQFTVWIAYECKKERGRVDIHSVVCPLFKTNEHHCVAMSIPAMNRN
jgi:hypothetical protein